MGLGDRGWGAILVIFLRLSIEVALVVVRVFVANVRVEGRHMTR